MSNGDELFEGLPERQVPAPAGRGAPRLRHPERQQVGFELAALDDLVPDDHPVRAVKSREGSAGHPAAAAGLMMALWLWATVEGIGSARQLDRLCKENITYRWLCGGVTMNYRSLSEFRVAHGAELERLLADGVAALVAEGLVKLDLLAQDGLKVRAAAGTSSFRSRERLEVLGQAAQERVQRLRALRRRASGCRNSRPSASGARRRTKPR
jgi:transposase